MKFKSALIIALCLLSKAVFSDDCPSNFIEILEGDKDTNLYKRHVADLCIGQEVRIQGKVFNVDREGDGYELRIDSIPGSRVFEIEMVKNPGADMYAIKKDDIVIVKGKLKSFEGYINRYINLDEGVCIKCN